MNIQSNIRNYFVKIENDENFMSRLIELENTYFVIDSNVYNIYQDKLFHSINRDKLTIIEALESNKTIETVLEICERMTALPAKRNVRLISFGGGIIQDITGFVANIMYRGVGWIFVPTTLLAACDSCIGGKTSLNYKNYKNLLGTFFPPEEIYIYPGFFDTLSNQDFRSGLGEIVKFNILYGEKGLENIEKDINLLLSHNKKAINAYLKTSLEFKKPIVEKDEFDKGIRIHLNYAHTFGHAIESVSNYAIPHGIAIAMGMIVANRISLQRGILYEEFVLRSESVLKHIIHEDPTVVCENVDTMIDAMRKDKKQTSQNLTAILLNSQMKIEVFKDLKEEEIKKAINDLCSVLNE